MDFARKNHIATIRIDNIIMLNKIWMEDLYKLNLVGVITYMLLI